MSIRHTGWATKGHHKMKKTIQLGKCDYNGSGRKNCAAEITIELRDTPNGKVLSVRGGIWNPRHTDYYRCGQCLETILEFFPSILPIVEIWRKWHLNDMNGGTPEQAAIVDAFFAKKGAGYDYSEACEALKAAGKYIVDASAYNTAANVPASTEYAYGTQLLHWPLTPEVIEQVEEFCAKAKFLFD